MSETESNSLTPRPWGVHTISNMFARRDQVSAGLKDGRIVTAVCEPYSANRLQAAWWVLTGRAYAVVWPSPGDLEDALYPDHKRALRATPRSG
jgi:hypothetical protein